VYETLAHGDQHAGLALLAPPEGEPMTVQIRANERRAFLVGLRVGAIQCDATISLSSCFGDTSGTTYSPVESAELVTGRWPK
jgi:hypothetical protein